MKLNLIIAVCCAALSLAAHSAEQPLEATTSAGEKVRLLPNGRWEYVDQAKQTEAKKVFDTYRENRDPDAQGGLAGFGRTIKPGDKDYNRGTLNPKAR
ncbi:MAG TPA: hypothetical protein VJU83_02355 [Burkholderiales bacterium]|nr:hypothetical protein [Burkholderiales bacterium]